MAQEVDPAWTHLPLDIVELKAASDTPEDMAPLRTGARFPAGTVIAEASPGTVAYMRLPIAVAIMESSMGTWEKLEQLQLLFNTEHPWFEHEAHGHACFVSQPPQEQLPRPFWDCSRQALWPELRARSGAEHEEDDGREVTVSSYTDVVHVVRSDPTGIKKGAVWKAERAAGEAHLEFYLRAEVIKYTTGADVEVATQTVRDAFHASFSEEEQSHLPIIGVSAITRSSRFEEIKRTFCCHPDKTTTQTLVDNANAALDELRAAITALATVRRQKNIIRRCKGTAQFWGRSWLAAVREAITAQGAHPPTGILHRDDASRVNMVPYMRAFGLNAVRFDATDRSVYPQLFACAARHENWDVVRYIYNHLPVMRTLAIRTQDRKTKTTVVPASGDFPYTHCTARDVRAGTVLWEELFTKTWSVHGYSKLQLRSSGRLTPPSDRFPLISTFQTIERMGEGSIGKTSRNFLSESEPRVGRIPLFIQGVLHALDTGGLLDWVDYFLAAGVPTDWAEGTSVFKTRCADTRHFETPGIWVTFDTIRWGDGSTPIPLCIDVTNASTVLKTAWSAYVVLHGEAETERKDLLLNRIRQWDPSSLRADFARLVVQCRLAGPETSTALDEPPTRKSRGGDKTKDSNAPGPTSPPPSRLLLALLSDRSRILTDPDPAQTDRFGDPATHSITAELSQVVAWFL